MKVKLSLLVEAIDRANVDEYFYLNKGNYRVWSSSSNGNYYTDNYEIIEDDELYDSSIILSGGYEINEYLIMQEFIETIVDEQIKNLLFIVIQGKGAFRRFKDTCINYGLIDKWYEFKNNFYYDLAKEWCEQNKIDYFDDVKNSF